MQVCEEARRCAFYAHYVDTERFREEHFHYFCFGPLSENCARRLYHQDQEDSPGPDFSPIGSWFTR